MNKKDKQLNILLFSLGFLLVFSFSSLGAFSQPTGSPPNSNSMPPMNISSDANSKDAGLSVEKLVSGVTDVITIDINGNIGVKGVADPATRMYINSGSLKSSSLSGTGTKAICTSSSGLSTDGYPLVRCP